MDCKNVVAVTDSTNYSALLEEAALLVRQSLKIECPLIHVSCLNTVSDVELYLVPFFEGETFDTVKEKGVPIIGPAAIIFLIKQEILLPRRLKKGQHIFSLSLHGSRVCCSNIDKETRDILYKQVAAMGGNISTALTSDVTHLVVDEVGSMKYQYAAKLGIPIMTPDWISALWDKSKLQVVKNDRSWIDEYKCLPFRGCTICVTGLDVGQRSEVEQLAKKHGGTYSGDLVMEKCTHLIADCNSGNKFEFAMKWKIPCVRSAWFYESIKKGVCLDVKEYQHSSDKENRTQDASYLARPMLEETRDLANNSHAPGNEGGILRQLHNLDLDVTVNKDKGYLEGCRIFLSGFSALEQDTLKKIINNGGGMRLDVLSTRVTHIVTKVTILKEIENLVSLHPDAAVLSADWLIRSMETGAQEPEHKYDLVPTTDHVTPGNPLPTLRPVRPTTQSGSDSILDQYRTTNTNADVTVLSRDVTMTSGDVTASITTNDTTGAAVDRTQAQNASMVIKSDLFKGYKFYIPTNVPTKIARNVQQQIIAHGGCCRQDDIDFCVVDPFQEQPPCCPDKTHVTYMWLQRCIQAGLLLSVSDCILFSPRHVPTPCHVLKGCVICYTQFSGFELAHLVKLVEALGGVCQGTFTQKTIKNHKRMADCLACTHIIYKRKELESSNKIKAAMKWNIPAVKIDWLYKCLETVSKVDSKLYEDSDMSRSNEVKKEKVLEEYARKIAEEMPKGVSGVTIKKNGVLKHDEEGFVTPMKIKLNKLIKVEEAMEALESPAPSHDTTISSLNTVYKRNIANAMKRTAPPSKVLGGVTLVVKQNKQIEVPVSEVKTLARRNGAVIKTYIDRSCTHVICSMKEMKESNIEQAIKQGVKAVSYHWIMTCDEQKRRLPEVEFPPGFDPKRALNISVSEDVQVSAVDIDNTVTVKHTSLLEDSHSLDPNLAKEIDMLTKIAPSEEKSTAFVAPGTPRSRHKIPKRSTTRRITPLEVPVEDLMSQAPPSVTYEDGQAGREALVAKTEDEAKRPAAGSHTLIPRPSTSPPVNPSPERSAISSHVVGSTVSDDTLNNSNLPNISLAPTSSSTPNRSSDQTPTVQKLSSAKALCKDKDVTDDFDFSDLSMEQTKVEEEKPKQFVFMLTGMNDAEKKMCGGVIENLGGELINSVGFDSRCTHLIASKPNRNEKFISSLGSGIWTLHPSYVTVSKEQGSWVNETSYTWDNFSSDLMGINKSLGEASCRWIKKKAFSTWRVVLCISSSKIRSFKGIIEVGGGCVIQDKPPYSVQSGTTHAFFESNQPLSDIPVGALIEAGVYCLKLEYIPEYLIHGDNQSKLENFLIEPAKKSLQNMTSSSKNGTTSNKRSIDTSLTGTPSKRSKT